MKLSISRDAVLPAAFVSAATRIFLDLALDGNPIHNGVWIAALLGALPVIPYLICLDLLAGQHDPPARRSLAGLLLTVTALDAARIVSVVLRTSGFLTLEPVNPVILVIPMALATLWCIWRNGDAIGYAAMLWRRAFPVLMLVVILLQWGHYRAQWIRPWLGNGWGDIVEGASRTASCYVPATSILFVCKPADKAVKWRPAVARIVLASAVAALLLVLRLMMLPSGMSDTPWISRLDALLTNGRAPLYLQLPMIVGFFTGIMHLLTCECFAASALLQQLVPGLGGRACAGIVVLICATLPFTVFFRSMQDHVIPWLFVDAAVPVALATLSQFRLQGGKRPCGD
jgi:hypothetical protein